MSRHPKNGWSERIASVALHFSLQSFDVPVELSFSPERHINTQLRSFSAQALDLKEDSLAGVEKLGAQSCTECSLPLCGFKLLDREREPLSIRIQPASNVDVGQDEFGRRHPIKGQPIHRRAHVREVARIDRNLARVQSLRDVGDQVFGLSSYAYSKRGELSLLATTVVDSATSLPITKPHCDENRSDRSNSLHPRRPVDAAAHDLNRNAHSANAVMILEAAA